MDLWEFQADTSVIFGIKGQLAVDGIPSVYSSHLVNLKNIVLEASGAVNTPQEIIICVSMDLNLFRS